jgi:hypothetical protein
MAIPPDLARDDLAITVLLRRAHCLDVDYIARADIAVSASR